MAFVLTSPPFESRTATDIIAYPSFLHRTFNLHNYQNISSASNVFRYQTWCAMYNLSISKKGCTHSSYNFPYWINSSCFFWNVWFMWVASCGVSRLQILVTWVVSYALRMKISVEALRCPSRFGCHHIQRNVNCCCEFYNQELFGSKLLGGFNPSEKICSSNWEYFPQS